MNVSPLFQKIVFIILILVCLLPIVSAPIALLLGFAMVNVVGNPFKANTAKIVKFLLKAAIVGLGFGMNFYSAINAGKDSFILTISTIILVLILGYVLGRMLNIERKTSYLVASGTAICGGSAIAAVSPIIDADPKQISVALGTVFILNAVALLLFPLIGHYFELTQYQFGLWSAIAIHDTSSVVGAASAYGEEALKIATTVKLGRALWIIPLSVFTVLITKKNKKGVDIPYFIGYFILAMLVSTFIPQFESFYNGIVQISKRALVITLFLIGAGLSIQVIKSTGAKTFIQGLSLWIIISIASLATIIYFY